MNNDPKLIKIWISTIGGEEGGIFEGTPEQFDDCFGITMQRPITEEHVRMFCMAPSHRFNYRLEYDTQ